MDIQKEDVVDCFQCGVCYQIFNENQRFPRILMCGHTFCEKCISQIINTEKIFKCPICKSNLGKLRLGLAYKNYSLIKLMRLNGIQSEEILQYTIQKSTFTQIVDELDRIPKNLRKLIIKRKLDDQNNPFQFDLIRSNKNSMRFYKLIPIFQNLSHFQFWVKFSAHGFEECLAQSLVQLKKLKYVKIVNAYDEFDRLYEIISLVSNESIEFDISVQAWQ